MGGGALGRAINWQRAHNAKFDVVDSREVRWRWEKMGEGEGEERSYVFQGTEREEKEVDETPDEE